MSHHQSPHRRALHIPVLILAGKFKMEFLPTVSHWKGFPVAQIRPNSHKIVSSYIGAFSVTIVSSSIRAFPVAQICPNSHKIVPSWIRAYLVAQIHPNLHKIFASRVRAFPVAQIRPNLHKIVSSCMRAFPVSQIRPNSHKIVSSCIRGLVQRTSTHFRPFLTPPPPLSTFHPL